MWGAALKPLDWAMGLRCCFSVFYTKMWVCPHVHNVLFFKQGRSQKFTFFGRKRNKKRSLSMGPPRLFTLPPHLTHRLTTIILQGMKEEHQGVCMLVFCL